MKVLISVILSHVHVMR